MPEPTDFVDQIIEGFRTLRERPRLDLLAQQFEAGELAFVVDRRGIQVHLGQVDVSPPEEADVDSTLD